MDGKAYALVFHDRVKDVAAGDTREVVALDPNGDGDFTDAKSVKTLKVGRGAAEGHFDHHDLAFDADRKFGFFTTWATGRSLSCRSRRWTWSPRSLSAGTPTALVTVGGLETDD